MPNEELLALDEEQIIARLNEWDQPPWSVLKQHERFNTKWVIGYLKRGRVIDSGEIRRIYDDRELRRSYAVCCALAGHPSTPPAIAVSLLSVLRWGDLLTLLRQPRLSGLLKTRSVQIMEERIPRLALGEQITLARRAVRPLIKVLRNLGEARVLSVLFRNAYFTYEDALFVASYPKTQPTALATLAQNPKWARLPEIARAIVVHPRTPNHALWPLIKSMSVHELGLLKADPRTPAFARRLIEKIQSRS